MKLLYRGSTYEYDPTQPKRTDSDRFENVREPFTLTYRGSVYRLDPHQQPAPATYQPRSAYQLTYRGDTYQVQPNGERTTVARPIRSSKTPLTVSAIALSRNLSKVHQANLERNLNRRIQSAQEKRDYALLALLEAEQRQLV